MCMCICVQCATGRCSQTRRPEAGAARRARALGPVPAPFPWLHLPPPPGCGLGRAESVLAQAREDRKPVLRLGLGLWDPGSEFSRIPEPAP